MHVAERNYSYFDLYELQFLLEVVMDNKSTLFQFMAWHRKEEKLLPEPMLTKDTYHMHHKASC